jgi:hypothetical protein
MKVEAVLKVELVAQQSPLLAAHLTQAP